VSDQSPRFRQVLDQFSGYKPGKSPSAGAARSFKLSANESPYEPLPSVRAIMADAAATIHRYPDNGAATLTEAIAGRFGVPAEHVAVGCGSVGVAQQLLEAVGEPGAEILFAWRSFEAYPYLTELAGAKQVRVPLAAGYRHDLPAMAAAITGQTRMIFVCNPNNPTGTVVREAELTEFLDRVPGDCLVVLDEAYVQYIRDREVPDGIELYRDRPNVAVLRTFSKAYGLAGLRVGFLIGHEPVVQAVRKTMLTFAVNSLAQVAAVASLAAESELLERVEQVVKERDRVRQELLGQGWTVPVSEANFVWLPIAGHADDFAASCDRAGVSVRPFQPDGVRVTIADPEANDAFLAVARSYPHRR
jgi:histidinol-phosphate aminotransferase